MVNIYFVRHGETSWNRNWTYQGSTNVPLNERGLEQAKACASALKNIDFAHIITSDLSRALTTASVISEFHKETAFTVDARLREIDFGKWEGLTHDVITERWPGMIDAMYQNSADMSIPGGENFLQLQKRAWSSLEETINKCKDKDNILVVCHGGTNRALICKTLGISLKHAWNFRQGNTGISLVEYFDNGDCNTLQFLNDTRHIMHLEGENVCG